LMDCAGAVDTAMNTHKARSTTLDASCLIPSWSVTRPAVRYEQLADGLV
jgi:hypothetical protein